MINISLVENNRFDFKITPYSSNNFDIGKYRARGNIKKNLQSLDEAGTYIYLTAFEIDISTGFKSFTSSNEVFSKIK